MPPDFRAKCRDLQSLRDEDAFIFISKNFPPKGPYFGDAMSFISHRSWKPKTQIALAQLYLPAMFPAGIAMALKAFGHFMASHKLMAILWKLFSCDSEKLEMLAYHLPSTIGRCLRSDLDRKAYEQLMERIGLTQISSKGKPVGENARKSQGTILDT